MKTFQDYLEENCWVGYKQVGMKKKGDKMSEYKWREKEIDQHECKCAVIGKLREFNCLYKLWQSFPKKFTRKETNEAQP